MSDIRLIHGDCLSVLPTLPDASVDCVITDPPYPCIKRSYGVWTEAEWFAMMRVVVPECMRILKPTGSAVFILQPNSERVGRMRTWLWEFMVWVGKEWGIVQDAWWWNTGALPLTKNDPNQMRASVKACVWIGPEDCYRDVAGVRWGESQASATFRQQQRCYGEHQKGAATRVNLKRSRMYEAAAINGGVQPFNLLPLPSGGPRNPATGHGAPTPAPLVSWWLRYICPLPMAREDAAPSDTAGEATRKVGGEPAGATPAGPLVLDPFSGSGAVALAAMQQGKSAIGIERIDEYHAIAERRIAAARNERPLLTGTSQ